LAAGLCLLALTAGCGGGGARIQGLSQHSADQLLASQAAKSALDQRDRKPLSVLELERQGDGESMKGEWLAGLLYYEQAFGKAEAKPARDRITGKIGMVLLKTKAWDRAEVVLQKAVAAQPSQASLWRGLGYARLGRNRLAGAEEALTRALSLDPNDWRAANALGVALNWEKRPAEAQAAFQRALSIKPGNPAVLNNLGLAFLLQGQTGPAERAFLAALESRQGFEKAANNLGALYAKLGRNDEALKAFTRGVGRARAHNNLGCYLAWRGDTLGASQHFRLALRAMPAYYQKAGRNLRQINGEGPLDQ